MRPMDDILQGVKTYVQVKENQRLIKDFLAAADKLARVEPDYRRVALDIGEHAYDIFGTKRPAVDYDSYVNIKTEKDYESFLPSILEQAIERARELGTPPMPEDIQTNGYVQIVIASEGGNQYHHGASVGQVPIGSVGRVTGKYDTHVKVEWWGTAFNFVYHEIRPVEIKVVKETVQQGDLKEGDLYIVKLEKASDDTSLPKDEVFRVLKVGHSNKIYATTRSGTYIKYDEVSKIEAVLQTSFSQADEETVKELVKKIVDSAESTYQVSLYNMNRRHFNQLETKKMLEAGFTQEELDSILAENGFEGVLR